MAISENEPTTLEEAFTHVNRCVNEVIGEYPDVGPDDVAHEVILAMCSEWKDSHPDWVKEILRCELGITVKEANL